MVVCPLAPPAALCMQFAMQVGVADEALASARHICTFTQDCVQRATGSVEDELDEPQPSVAATPRPIARINLTADFIEVVCITLLMVVVGKARP